MIHCIGYSVSLLQIDVVLFEQLYAFVLPIYAIWALWGKDGLKNTLRAWIIHPRWCSAEMMHTFSGHLKRGFPILGKNSHILFGTGGVSVLQCLVFNGVD